MTSHFDETAKAFAVMKQASRLLEPWSLGEVHADEPHATWGQQLKLSLVSMFVEEDLL